MKELLKELCCAAGAGGYGEIVNTVKGRLDGLVQEVYTDALGSVIGVRRCQADNAPLLLLEAHMDEIGFVVTHVDDDGFVHAANCGGIDRRVLAAAEVTLLADKKYDGVFCSTPPHLTKADEPLKELSEMGIDIGLPATEVKRVIPKGTRGVFRPHFEELGLHRVCAKALDDRSGCAAVLRAMELLKDEELCCDVAALFAVQEEIGGGGAAVASFSIQPSAAIAVDVSFAATPDAPSHKCGVLGKGAMLGMAPGLDEAMTKRLRQLAADNGLPLQYEVMGGNTGTDADSILCARGGVKTALLSIPQRYMHTPIEVVDVRDVETVAKLMALAAKEGIGA